MIKAVIFDCWRSTIFLRLRNRSGPIENWSNWLQRPEKIFDWLFGRSLAGSKNHFEVPIPPNGTHHSRAGKGRKRERARETGEDGFGNRWSTQKKWSDFKMSSSAVGFINYKRCSVLPIDILLNKLTACWPVAQCYKATSFGRNVRL